MRSSLLLLLPCVVVALMSCSSPSDCTIAVGTDPAGSRFASPLEMDRTGCEPGTLAGFNPTGFWYVEEEEMALFSGGGPVRIEADCGSSLVVHQSRIADTVVPEWASLDASDLFWRREQVFNDGELRLVTAYNPCRLDADGTLHGHSVRCLISSEGEDCRTRELVMSPFGRVEGETEAEGLTLLAEYGGSPTAPWPTAFTANVRVADDLAYVVRSDGLRIVDVSDLGALTEVGAFLSAGIEESLNDLKLASGPGGALYALLASNARGILVVDVTDPTAPTLVETFTPTGEPTHGVHTLFLETLAGETRAYLADGFSDLVAIVDVTDPTAPLSLGGLLVPDPRWEVHDLFVENGVIYANATVGGLVIADALADPTNPTVLGTAPSSPGYSHSNWVTTAGGRKISVSGDEGYGAFAAIVDVDPVSPGFLQTIGEFHLRDKVSVHNIMAAGDRAYIAHYQDGIRVLDLSDPTNPTQIAHFNSWDPETAPGAKFEGAAGLDLDLAANRIYVADTRGLLVLGIEP